MQVHGPLDRGQKSIVIGTEPEGHWQLAAKYVKQARTGLGLNAKRRASGSGGRLPSLPHLHRGPDKTPRRIQQRQTTTHLNTWVLLLRITASMLTEGYVLAVPVGSNEIDTINPPSSAKNR